MKKVYMVSACLLGLSTRYDGKSKKNEKVVRLCEDNICVPFCPEQLGGLPTPRPPCYFIGGDGNDVLLGRAKIVEKESKKDRTLNFLKGAREALFMAQVVKPHVIILKDKSPSCGVNTVDIEGKKVKGCGVTCALLKKEGYEVKSYG